MTKRFRCLLATAALACQMILGLPHESPAAAAPAEAVTINTNMVVFTPPVRTETTVAAVETVILLPGGNGLLALDVNGTPTSLSGNFLIRSANEFLNRGMNVMMADVAPAFPTGISYTNRLGGIHAGHIQGFVNAAATRWPGRCGSA